MLGASSRTNGRLPADAGSFVVERIIVTIREWWRGARSRRDLAALDPRDWRDLRLTRSDVMREASKSFWKE
jgi:uncharacterized protein YjiS (DUF1127 family)